MVTDLQHPWEDGTQLPRWHFCCHAINPLPFTAGAARAAGSRAAPRLCRRPGKGSAPSCGINYKNAPERCGPNSGTGPQTTAATKGCRLHGIALFPPKALRTRRPPAVLPAWAQPWALPSPWGGLQWSQQCGAASRLSRRLCSRGVSITVVLSPSPSLLRSQKEEKLGKLLFFPCYKFLPLLPYLPGNELHKQNSFMQSSFYFPAFVPICIYFYYN